MSTGVSSALGLDHALLALLRRRPLHAYELYQRLAHTEALGLVWHLKQGNLYALLGKLEAAGYLTGSVEPQGTRPPRKVLRLTEAGQEVVSRWLTTPVEHGRDVRQEFLAKLYFAAEDGRATVRRLLEAQRVECRRWLVEMAAQVEAAGTEQPYERLVLRFRIGQLEAILPWLDECEQALARGNAGDGGPLA